MKTLLGKSAQTTGQTSIPTGGFIIGQGCYIGIAEKAIAIFAQKG